MNGNKITWTSEMDDYVRNYFPTEITKDMIPVLGVSLRSIIRRARELGVEKESGFLEKNRLEISKRAQANKKPNPNKGNSNFRIPGGENHQFKKGQERFPVDYSKIHEKRNETIRKEKLRLKYGLKLQTKMKLVNFY